MTFLSRVFNYRAFVLLVGVHLFYSGLPALASDWDLDIPMSMGTGMRTDPLMQQTLRMAAESCHMALTKAKEAVEPANVPATPQGSEMDPYYNSNRSSADQVYLSLHSAVVKTWGITTSSASNSSEPERHRWSREVNPNYSGGLHDHFAFHAWPRDPRRWDSATSKFVPVGDRADEVFAAYTELYQQLTELLTRVESSMGLPEESEEVNEVLSSEWKEVRSGDAVSFVGLFLSKSEDIVTRDTPSTANGKVGAGWRVFFDVMNRWTRLPRERYLKAKLKKQYACYDNLREQGYSLEELGKYVIDPSLNPVTRNRLKKYLNEWYIFNFAKDGYHYGIPREKHLVLIDPISRVHRRKYISDWGARSLRPEDFNPPIPQSEIDPDVLVVTRPELLKKLQEYNDAH